MSRLQRVIPFLLFTFFILTAPARAVKHETGFLNRAVTVGRSTYRYQVYVPANWDKKQKWPVILFLHGSVERGGNGLEQTQAGLGTALRFKTERFPAIVVFPQCQEGTWWLSLEMEALALKALDESIREFNGDPQRVYLTGLSMGGDGTWSIASRNPGKFAAVVPVCGGVTFPPNIAEILGMKAEMAVRATVDAADPYAEVARRIGRTPVWIFHGEKDTLIPADEARKMSAALKAAGGNVRYTEYKGIGHNSWDLAYSESELVSWLFAQRLGANTAEKKDR
jgi:predicted peptidase